MAFTTQRLPMMRSEISSNFDAGETSQLFSLRYDSSSVPTLAPGNNLEDQVSSKPIIIYDYKLEFVTDGIAQIYQQYCNYDATPDEMTGYLDWNLNSEQFYSSLKQHKLIAGAQTDDASFWQKGTLYYKAKGYWSKRHKEWRWNRPPIILSKNRKNYFALMCANVSNSDDRSFYACITIKNYAQIL